MKEPLFLGLDEVIEIHRDQIERYGGHPGTRDIELLKSAVAAVVFLMMNGRGLHADEESFEAMVRSVAEGKLDKTGVAGFFRKHTR